MTHRSENGFVAMAVAGLLASGPAWSDDVHCPPDPGAVEIDGNVLVTGACRLDGTTVKGNVELFAGGSLDAVGATIVGNIQADAADFVDVSNTEIGGSVQLDNMVGAQNSITDSSIEGSVQQSSSLSTLSLAGNVIGADVQVFSNQGEVIVDDNEVTGSVQLEDVAGGTSGVYRSAVNGSVQLKGNATGIEVLDSTIGADVQVFENTGGVLIENNVVDGNLQCKENDPEPIGGGNQVSGNKEDQCADLQRQGASAAAASNNTPSLSSAGDARGDSGGGSFGLVSILMLLVLGTLRGFVRNPKS